MEVRDRFGLLDRTELRTISRLEDLPYAHLLPQMYDSVLSIGWKYQKNPVHNLPEYGLVNHAKIGLVKKAIERNTFGSDFFVWIDASGGHGDRAYWADWCPCVVAVKSGRPTFFGIGIDVAKAARGGEAVSMATFAEDIRTVTLPSVVGTFWGGSPAGLLAFHEEYTK